MKWYSLSKIEGLLLTGILILLVYVYFDFNSSSQLNWTLLFISAFLSQLIWPFSIWVKPSKSLSMFTHPKKNIFRFVSIFTFTLIVFIAYFLIPETDFRHNFLTLIFIGTIGYMLGMIRYWYKYKKFNPNVLPRR